MKKQTKTKINKNMNFIEIIQKNPDAFEILFKKGMHCVGCGMAGSETLEEGALAHGINPDKLVDEINSSFKKKPRRKTKLNSFNKVKSKTTNKKKRK